MTNEERKIVRQMKKKFDFDFSELESAEKGRLIFFDADLKTIEFKDWNEVESFLETSKQN